MENKTIPSIFEVQKNFYKDQPLMEVNNRNVYALLSLLQGEMAELSHEILNNGYDPEMIVYEAADVALFAFAIMLAFSADPETVLREKIGRNAVRYPSQDFQELGKDFKAQVAASKARHKATGEDGDFFESI